MKWVGLTGGIGTGKTTAAQILRENGVPVVDADQIAREVIQKGTPGHREVVKTFGPDLLGPDGEIDRTRLGEIVFRNPDQRAALEAIVHPLVRERTAQHRKALTSQGHAFAIYDVPLLFEKSMKDQFDLVLVVACSRELQIERAIRRTGLPRTEIERRISSQVPLDQKIRQADVVFQNNGTLDELRVQLLTWLKAYQDQV